jgi:hypothetical protein
MPNKKKENWVLSFYIFYSLLSAIFLNIAIQSVSHKEFLSYRIYTIVEGLSFMWIFHLILKNVVAKKTLIVLAIIFLGVSIFDLSQSRAESFDSLPAVIECLILIAYSILYFYEELKDTTSLFLYTTSTFWIVVGIFLFFSGSFFIFIYAQNNSHLPGFSTTFQVIMGISALIENILFLIAFIIAKNESKTIKSSQIAKPKLFQ